MPETVPLEWRRKCFTDSTERAANLAFVQAEWRQLRGHDEMKRKAAEDLVAAQNTSADAWLMAIDAVISRGRPPGRLWRPPGFPWLGDGGSWRSAASTSWILSATRT